MQGTRDPSAWLAVPAALEFARDRQWRGVAAACADLAWETAERIRCRTGLPPLCDREFSAPQMIAMPVPDCDPIWLGRTLHDRYGIEIPVVSWRGRIFLRISIQGYNEPEEADRFVAAVSDLLDLPTAA